MVSVEGSHVEPSKTEAVRNWSIPKFAKDVMEVLGYNQILSLVRERVCSHGLAINDPLVGYLTNPKA